MKFTIDTEEKTIYFRDSFTKEDIEYLISVLDIEGIESWKISMEETPKVTYPQYTPNTIPLPYYPNNPNEFITYCSTNTGDIDLTIGEYIYGIEEFTPNE